MKVPLSVRFGTQGICNGSTALAKTGLLLARALVTVSVGNTIPVKILNVTDKVISVPRGFK